MFQILKWGMRLLRRKPKRQVSSSHEATSYFKKPQEAQPAGQPELNSPPSRSKPTKDDAGASATGASRLREHGRQARKKRQPKDTVGSSHPPADAASSRRSAGRPPAKTVSTRKTHGSRKSPKHLPSLSTTEAIKSRHNSSAAPEARITLIAAEISPLADDVEQDAEAFIGAIFALKTDAFQYEVRRVEARAKHGPLFYCIRQGDATGAVVKFNRSVLREEHLSKVSFPKNALGCIERWRENHQMRLDGETQIAKGSPVESTGIVEGRSGVSAGTDENDDDIAYSHSASTQQSMEDYASYLAMIYSSGFNSHTWGAESATEAAETEVAAAERTAWNRAIKEEVSSRRIEYLLHFTDYRNLDSILCYGLLSPKIAAARGIQIHATDDQRIEGRLDSICLSISFPNYKMFFAKRQQEPQRQWAVLLISPEVLWTKRCSFYETNAATILSKNHVIQEGAGHFLQMFADKLLNNEGKLVMRTEVRTPACFATDPQAEILVHEPIDASLISCICFESEALMSGWIHQNLAGPSVVKVFCDASYFEARFDWKHWPSKLPAAIPESFIGY